MPISAISKSLRVESTKLDYLNALNEQELETLTTQLSKARKAQHAHVNEATRSAVDQLPRLLRKPVLKMFEGL
jgi:hypothetical protein